MTNYFPDRNDAPKLNLFPGIVARTCWSERLMLSYVELAPHAVVEEHQHPHDQAGYIIQGKAIFIVGGIEKTLYAGDWYLAPGNVRHKVITLEEPTLVLDVFTPPREEYKQSR
jgi:quercetin dioxygenase-like cupin family protein